MKINGRAFCERRQPEVTFVVRTVCSAENKSLFEIQTTVKHWCLFNVFLSWVQIMETLRWNGERHCNNYENLVENLNKQQPVPNMGVWESPQIISHNI